MQSEPGWPQIILHVYRRPPGEEGAKYRDSFMRTVRTCMSARRLASRAPYSTLSTAAPCRLNSLPFQSMYMAG